MENLRYGRLYPIISKYILCARVKNKLSTLLNGDTCLWDILKISFESDPVADPVATISIEKMWLQDILEFLSPEKVPKNPEDMFSLYD